MTSSALNNNIGFPARDNVQCASNSIPSLFNSTPTSCFNHVMESETPSKCNFSIKPTRREKHDGLEAGVLCRVHLQGLQLLHLLLEDADVIHEGHHSLRRHGRGVQAGRRQQGGHVKRHGALGGVEDKELAPRHAQQCHLERRWNGVITGARALLLPTWLRFHQLFT